MYTLYHDKLKLEIKLTNAKKTLQNLNYTDDVTEYNDCYFISKNKKKLKEFGEKIKNNWIIELEEKLNKLKETEL